MKNSKKLGLSVASFGAATLCLVGGTFAWYVVSNTGTATISGTTAKADGSLTIGIRPHTIEGAKALIEQFGSNGHDEFKVEAVGDEDIPTYEGTPPDVEGNPDVEINDIYWNYQAGSNFTEKGNQIKASHLRAVYYNDGYTDRTFENFIAPVTSRHFNDKDLALGTGDVKNDNVLLYDIPDRNALAGATGNYDSDTSIYTAPVHPGDEALEDELAQYTRDLAKYKDGIKAIKEKYMSFTLVFNTNGVANQPIYLDNASTYFIGGDLGSQTVTHNVVKTLRVSFESNFNNYIYSPSNFSYDKVSTNVGGYLDLDADGVWDYNTTNIADTEKVNYFVNVTNASGLEAAKATADTRKVYYYDETVQEVTIRKAFVYDASTGSFVSINSSIVDKLPGGTYKRFDHKWYGEHEDLEPAATLLDDKYSVVVDNVGNHITTPVIGSNKNAFVGKFVKTDGTVFQSISYKFSNLVKPKTQDAHGIDYFVYHEDNSKNHPLAITDERGHAEVTIKIWTEGWDTNSVNDNKAPFTGSLCFHAPGLGN
ncbi:MAG: hypothetical protein ACI31I_02155 [Bacilli bacterium]